MAADGYPTKQLLLKLGGDLFNGPK
jgi:hypothetical protein